MNYFIKGGNLQINGKDFGFCEVNPTLYIEKAEEK